MKIIDATNLIFGRMAASVAKLALSGEQVAVVNCEKAIISGKSKMILEDYKHRRERKGFTMSGPFYPRRADMMVKRAVRGMLPKKHWAEGCRGRIAFSRVKCYLGVPDEFKGKKIETIKGASAEKLKIPYHIKLGELSNLLGYRHG